VNFFPPLSFASFILSLILYTKEFLFFHHSLLLSLFFST
jgi:hypothetical protein